MHAWKARSLILAALLAVAAGAGAARAASNGAAPDLSGVWVLDKEHSDDPSKLMRNGGSREGHGPPPGGGMGGGMGGGGWGGHHGRGGEGGGGHRGEADRGQRPNPQPEKLIIYRKADSIQIDDGSGRERALDWSDKNATYPDSARVAPAHWDGKKLVADMKSPRGGSRSVTYETDSSGKNLTVTLRFQRPDGDSVTLRSRYTKYDGADE